MTASSMSSWAQPTHQRARLKKGQPAPFAGTLLNDAAVAKITTAYEKQIDKLQLQLDKLKREIDLVSRTAGAVCTAKLDAEKAKRQACMDDKARQRKLFFQTLDSKKCPHPAWNYLSFIGGAVFGGGVCALAEGVK